MTANFVLAYPDRSGERLGSSNILNVHEIVASRGISVSSSNSREAGYGQTRTHKIARRRPFTKKLRRRGTMSAEITRRRWTARAGLVLLLEAIFGIAPCERPQLSLIARREKTRKHSHGSFSFLHRFPGLPCRFSTQFRIWMLKPESPVFRLVRN